MQRYFLILGVMIWGCVGSVQALKVEITQGQIQPISIAITDFEDETEEGIGKQISEIITRDLVFSGLFQPIPKAAFIQDTSSLNTQGPRYADWRALNAKLLLSGKVKRVARDLIVEFSLYDVISGHVLTGFQYRAVTQKQRQLAHMVSDTVYQQATGEEGFFNTRIAFVEETGPRGRRIKRLALMDYDGENVSYLTTGDSIVLTPRFSPDKQHLAFLSYSNRIPQVFLTTVDGAPPQHVGDFQGMSYAPRFSPDGECLVMSLEKEGASAIFEYRLRDKSLKQLTPYHTIDISPCYSPDGKHIVFTSDRGGSEQIYIMNRDGSHPRRVSFGGTKYSQPAWSPRGDLIAFTKVYQGTFYIGVMTPQGEDERLVAQGYLVEGAGWSPNGRRLLYTKEHKYYTQNSGGKRIPSATSRLYSVDVTGYHECAIRTPHEASDGCWSPRL